MTGMDKDYRWGHLDKQKVGRFGEYFAKMEFLRSGFDVYSPEVDDKAIDCLLRIDGPEPIYLEVQIKTVRLASPGYVFMRKRHFSLHANRRLALVVLQEGHFPELYLLPASLWQQPVSPFSSKDYEGLKSDPEYGLTVSPKSLAALEPYRLSGARSLEATVRHDGVHH